MVHAFHISKRTYMSCLVIRHNRPAGKVRISFRSTETLRGCGQVGVQAVTTRVAYALAALCVDEPVPEATRMYTCAKACYAAVGFELVAWENIRTESRYETGVKRTYARQKALQTAGGECLPPEQRSEADDENGTALSQMGLVHCHVTYQFCEL